MNFPMPPGLVSQLRVWKFPIFNGICPISSKAVGPVCWDAPGASGSASLPSAPMQVFKHVFFVGNARQFVDGPLVGTPVPNISQNCVNMQHETTLTIRSVSPTLQEQAQASGWPGALSPKGWVIAASGKCHRIYE